jgi:hypothetical protein
MPALMHLKTIVKMLKTILIRSIISNLFITKFSTYLSDDKSAKEFVRKPLK